MARNVPSGLHRIVTALKSQSLAVTAEDQAGSVKASLSPSINSSRQTLRTSAFG